MTYQSKPGPAVRSAKIATRGRTRAETRTMAGKRFLAHLWRNGAAMASDGAKPGRTLCRLIARNDNRD